MLPNHKCTCGFSLSLSFLPPCIAFLLSLNVFGTNHKHQRLSTLSGPIEEEALTQISGQHVDLCLSLMTSGPLTFVGLSGNELCHVALTHQRGSCHIHPHKQWLPSENIGKW